MEMFDEVVVWYIFCYRKLSVFVNSDIKLWVDLFGERGGVGYVKRSLKKYLIWVNL